MDVSKIQKLCRAIVKNTEFKSDNTSKYPAIGFMHGIEQGERKIAVEILNMITKEKNMNRQNRLEEYESISTNTIKYTDLIKERLNGWMQIERFRMHEHYNDIANCLNATTADYAYKFYSNYISCYADIYFSGCGAESEDFAIPLDIILLNDKEWKQFLIDLEKDIENANVIFKSEKEKEAIEKEAEQLVKNAELRKAQYEKLRTEFEGNE